FVPMSELGEAGVNAAEPATATEDTSVAAEAATVAAARAAWPAKHAVAATPIAPVATTCTTGVAMKAAIAAAESTTETLATSTDFADATASQTGRGVHAPRIVLDILAIGDGRGIGDVASAIVLRERFARNGMEIAKWFAGGCSLSAEKCGSASQRA